MTNDSFMNLRRPPVRIFFLELNKQVLDLERQFVGLAVWSPTSVCERFQTTLFIALDDFVTGYPRYTKFAAKRRN